MRILLFLSILSYTISYSQVWFDANWKETTKENGIYYRNKPSKLKKGFWSIDFFKDGKIKREGFLTNPKGTNFDGLVTEYYKNGNINIKYRYKNGILNGICKIYFKTGELKKMYRYRNNKPDGIFKEFHKTGKIHTKGKYKKGEKVGIWKTFYKNEYEGFLNDKTE